MDKLGEGPDEYSFMSHIFVDENEEYIDVVDGRESGVRLLKYSNISFELLKDTPFYSPSANSSRRENNIYYFSTQQLENYINRELTNADIIVVRDADIQKVLFKKKIITEGNNFSANSESFTVNEKGEIFISMMYNNTFYRLSNMGATPILTIDFGSYGIDNTIGLKSTQEQMRYLRDDTDGLAYFPILNINNSNMLAFSYYFKNHSKGRLHHYIQFKHSRKNIHVNEIINDISNFPEKIHLSTYFSGINHEVYYEDNYLVDIIVPSQYLEDRKSEIKVEGLGLIKAEDNPIIILMKLKEEITELQ